jgi:hypothetical protein
MLSEIDIKDWVKSEQPLKLFTVPRNSVVSTENNPLSPFFFHKIDGMYSICCELNDPADVFHLAAFTDVFLWKRK